ncbi:TonB-dependent receptor [Massilia sp. H-1]|nr:TonB-dependent receptor [Massilia sp. H-1]
MNGKLGASRWDVALDGSYVHSFKTHLISSDPWVELVGKYNQTDLQLRWKHQLRFTWATGPWSTTLTQLFKSGYKDQNLEDLGGTLPPGFNPDVKSYTLYNLSASYAYSKNLSFSAGIKNLLDTDPSFSAHNVDEVAGRGLGCARGRSARPCLHFPRELQVHVSWDALPGPLPVLKQRAFFFLQGVRWQDMTRSVTRVRHAGGRGCRMCLPARAPVPARRSLVKPPRLRFGDTIGLVAPGGHTDEEGIARATARIEQLGFRVKVGANLRAVHGNYGGTVRQRVDDLHVMFADPAVRAIWCIRGGSGCISLLSSLDYGLIRKHPTILLGYSDITALHLALYRQA